MKNIITKLLLIISFTVTAKDMNAQDVKQSSESYKVVFQLSTNDTLEQKAFVHQLHNLTVALNDVTIEVVVLGPGISFIKKSSRFSSEIESLYSPKLKFLVCRNTMIQRKVDPSELIPVAEVIPAGLAHIIKRQHEHWSYIKVGF